MGKLILVGTPIGNLEDISLRAIKALFTAHYIVCEDTRRAGQLLHLLRERVIPQTNIDLGDNQPRLISYRDQNHERTLPGILNLLQTEDILLISDSGMPTISDPGYKLVKAVIDNGIAVDVIPGPTALASAMAMSGLPTDKFSFLGFLPRTPGQAKKLLQDFGADPATLIVYESPLRIKKLLSYIGEVLPDREVVIVCELTKLHQRRYSGKALDLLSQLGKIQGECVVLISKSFT